MNIVDVDITALRKASRKRRARSSETVALIRAIDELMPGRAKAIIIEPGQTGGKVRAKLAYAARAAGKRLRIAVEEDQVLFALKGEPRRRRRRRAAP